MSCNNEMKKISEQLKSRLKNFEINSYTDFMILKIYNSSIMYTLKKNNLRGVKKTKKF